MTEYDCDRCGACCKGHLLVEAYELDVLRERKLISAEIHGLAQHMLFQDVMHELEDDGKCLIIAGGSANPCKFLDDDHRCSIYPTRPNVCVAMTAGDEQCQDVREAEGLPPLGATEGLAR